MTGCLGEDDIEFTINSRHSGATNMFTWSKDGKVEAVIDKEVSFIDIDKTIIVSFGCFQGAKSAYLTLDDSLEVPEVEIDRSSNATVLDSRQSFELPESNLLKLKVAIS